MRVHAVGSEITAIDLFCGIGGSSSGIKSAGARLVAAANHSAYAIDVHANNHPDAEHFQADLIDTDAECYVHPRDLPPARVLWASPSCKFHSPANARKLYRSRSQAEQLDLFQGYVEARDDDEADYSLSERSRTTMVCPWLYAEKHQPDLAIVENVVEVTRWGPDRDGSQFQDWLYRWTLIGYEYECVFLNSGFFPPCPQSRDRIYIVFWKKGNPKPDLEHRPETWCARCGETTRAYQWFKPQKPSWPLPKWGKYGAQYLYRCLGCNEEVVPYRVPAAAVIDWSNLGSTLAERERPLAEKTVARIRRGLTKFSGYPPVVIDADGNAVIIPNGGEDALNGYIFPAAGNTYERPGQIRGRHPHEQLFSLTGTLEHGIATAPLMVQMRGGGSVRSGQHPVTGPMHTVTAGANHHGLATLAGFAKFNGGPADTAWHDVFAQFGTITGRDTTGFSALTVPLVHGNSDDRYRHALEQLATLTTARERYLALGMPEVDWASVPLEEFAHLVRFRMLEPEPELLGGMGFDPGYLLHGTKSQMTMGLGNAVTPPPAEFLMERGLAALDAPTSQRRLDAA